MRIGSLIRLTNNLVSGRASATGFRLSRGNKVVASKNWQEDSEVEIPRSIKWLTAVIGTIIITISYFSLVATISPQAGMTLIEIIVIFYASCISFIRAVYFIFYVHSLYWLLRFWWVSRPDLREYHACEHKTIGLLISKLPLTLENLKKMPRVSFTCGTTLCAIVLVVVPLFYLAAQLAFGIANDHFFIGVFLGSALPFLFFILAGVVTFIFQYFITTAEPSEEKLLEALEVAKNFAQQIQ